MDEHHRLLTWCCIFKLSLLLITVLEASRKVDESNIGLNDRVFKIETNDRHQNDGMALLKNALDEERKLVHDLTNRVAILEDSNKIYGRPKRPARLLPPHILRGKEKNETDDESQIRFYGPATGCNDLGKLGYTLNGFYLVQEKGNNSTNSSSSSNNKQIEIVECRFRHNKKIGNQTHHDKEKRLGFIQTNNGINSNILPSRLDVKEDFHAKEVNDKDKGWLNQTKNDKILGGNVTQSRLNDLKKADDIEKESKVTHVVHDNEKRHMLPHFDLKNDCLYRFKSVALNSCLVVQESKIYRNESIKTTNLPNYHLDQLSCDNLNLEKHWILTDKHICSNIKEHLCLAVSYGLKDKRAFLNLMAYDESSMFQQWIITANNSKTAVINVATALCLNSMNGNTIMKATTTVKTCDKSNLKKENMFYFQQAILNNRKNCPPLKNVEEDKNRKIKKKL